MSQILLYSLYADDTASYMIFSKFLKFSFILFNRFNTMMQCSIKSCENYNNNSKLPPGENETVDGVCMCPTCDGLGTCLRIYGENCKE